MPPRPRPTPRLVVLASLVALAPALGLGGCASDANPVRDLAMSAGITGGEPKPAPDFISRSRTDGVDYMPIGEAAPKRRYRVRTKEDTEKAEADLNRMRSANEARGLQARRAASASPAPQPAKARPPAPE